MVIVDELKFLVVVVVVDEMMVMVAVVDDGLAEAQIQDDRLRQPSGDITINYFNFIFHQFEIITIDS